MRNALDLAGRLDAENLLKGQLDRHGRGVGRPAVLLLGRGAVDEVEAFGQPVQDGGDLFRRVLQVVVDGNDDGMLRGPDAAQEGVVLAVITHQFEAADLRPLFDEAKYLLPTVVGAAVADEDDLERHPSPDEDRVQRANSFGRMIALLYTGMTIDRDSSFIGHLESNRPSDAPGRDEELPPSGTAAGPRIASSSHASAGRGDAPSTPTAGRVLAWSASAPSRPGGTGRAGCGRRRPARAGTRTCTSGSPSRTRPGGGHGRASRACSGGSDPRGRPRRTTGNGRPGR